MWTKTKIKFIAFDYSIVIEYFFDMNSMIVHVDMYVFPCMMAWWGGIYACLDNSS